jgi:hypothetical protein
MRKKINKFSPAARRAINDFTSFHRVRRKLAGVIMKIVFAGWFESANSQVVMLSAAKHLACNATPGRCAQGDEIVSALRLSFVYSVHP